MNMREFRQDICDREVKTLVDLNMRSRFLSIVSTSSGIRRFATSFYFIRYFFYKLNFIVGARSDPHERYWSGLVHNLLEELGGGKTASHNQLYRDFLDEVGVHSENGLVQPLFAERFNYEWEDYCRTKPFEQVLAAIAVYEILDNPDYELLYDVLRATGLSARGLKFFEVHAQAEHFGMFENIVQHIISGPGGWRPITRAREFVLNMQRYMWVHLLDNLEQPITSRCSGPASPRLDRLSDACGISVQDKAKGGHSVASR